MKRRLDLDNEALSRYAEYYPKPAVSKTLLRWGCWLEDVLGCAWL